MADVICPGCGGRYHETTERFNPDVQPNGTMFTLKEQFGAKGWNWSGFAESESSIGGLLVCPNCDVPYVGQDGRVRLDMETVCDDEGGQSDDGYDSDEPVQQDDGVDDAQQPDPEPETHVTDDEPDSEPEQGLFDVPDPDQEDLKVNHSGFICPVCEKECATERGLNQHMTMKHSDMEDVQLKPEVTNG